MATITGNTAGSLKKMWPPVKKKALEAHPSFAAFLGTDGSNIAAPKAAGGRKRKAAADSNVEDADPKSAEERATAPTRSTARPTARSRPRRRLPPRAKAVQPRSPRRRSRTRRTLLTVAMAWVSTLADTKSRSGSTVLTELQTTSRKTLKTKFRHLVRCTF
jgi:hypothetical protein